ncbi:MAG: EFR1 family ferrodoxin, partial [Oscillospiraceae bacterium]|nr:EFR1 family ferrodoxin [Oscillospiraceae bacterium]
MIFYFTGTGNSLYAAKALAHDGEALISMIDAAREKAFRYTLYDNEALGFVFPVYFYTVSDPVLEFVRNLTVENASFVYAVIPCGAGIGPAGGFLKSELKKRGLALQRVDALIVPDGALIFYERGHPEKMQAQLQASTMEIVSFRRAIERREANKISGSATAGKLGLAAYHACMSTRKFYADDKCIHCGK